MAYRDQPRPAGVVTRVPRVPLRHPGPPVWSTRRPGRPRGPSRRTEQIDPERPMRLADFLATNLEPILAAWEAFARTHVPVGEAMDVAGLRDHAADILRA